MEKAHFPVKTFHHPLDSRHAHYPCFHQNCMRSDMEGMIMVHSITEEGKKRWKFFSQVFKERKSFFAEGKNLILSKFVEILWKILLKFVNNVKSCCNIVKFMWNDERLCQKKQNVKIFTPFQCRLRRKSFYFKIGQVFSQKIKKHQNWNQIKEPWDCHCHYPFFCWLEFPQLFAEIQIAEVQLAVNRRINWILD